MRKDAYYFSHDSNAQDDPKCMLLIDQMGMEGYGIFWALIERLRCEKNYTLPLSVCNPFSKRWGTSREKIETVIRNYGLFEIDNESFRSARLLNSMTEKTEKARISASYRWGNANALQLDSGRNANGMRNDAIKGKERKGKKRKVAVGIKFDEKGENVIFEDGSIQKLGLCQLRRFKEGGFMPHYVKKGIIE